MIEFWVIRNDIEAMKELVAIHGYAESRLGGAKPVEHGGRCFALSKANYTLELKQAVKLLRKPSVNMVEVCS